MIASQAAMQILGWNTELHTNMWSNGGAPWGPNREFAPLVATTLEDHYPEFFRPDECISDAWLLETALREAGFLVVREVKGGEIQYSCKVGSRLYKIKVKPKQTPEALTKLCLTVWQREELSK